MGKLGMDYSAQPSKSLKNFLLQQTMKTKKVSFFFTFVGSIFCLKIYFLFFNASKECYIIGLISNTLLGSRFISSVSKHTKLYVIRIYFSSQDRKCIFCPLLFQAKQIIKRIIKLKCCYWISFHIVYFQQTDPCSLFQHLSII